MPKIRNEENIYILNKDRIKVTDFFSFASGSYNGPEQQC